MPEAPDVSAIVEQVTARIKQIEAEFARHERLSDELARPRDALGRLEVAARLQVSRRRRGPPRPGQTRRARPPRARSQAHERVRPPAARAA